ncbi:DUF5809 family protein [Haloquadratum walsbyi]|jgi:hypothetical protein|uniref:Uncharacterized protein n=1 Tax=Haloquadratum walsbyi J07HQW2 TaxID=1238425 RepID=U1PSW6_9EURY|nr:DUF5809 family protein [Haloquadratum walsbyi]ERG95456.1 MAG: hypothetical protein J07HQW2_01913 [Haloquadratum walsbyi J07HQW2]
MTNEDNTTEAATNELDTLGELAPTSTTTVHNQFDSLGSTAQTVVREIATAMGFDREEYNDRITSEVLEAARETLFAEQLAVRVGSRDEFEQWVDSHPAVNVEQMGSPNVARVAWHHAPFSDDVIAATFQNEQTAAVSTLRRHSFGEIYRPVIEDEPSADTDIQE